MLEVSNGITVLLELLSVLLCLANLYDRKIRINFNLIFLAVVYVSIFIGINFGSFPAYASMLAYVSIIIYCLFCYKKNFKITLINCFLTFSVISVLQLLFYFPIVYILNLPQNELRLEEILINLLCLLTIILLKKKIPLKEVADFILGKSWITKALFISVILYLFANIFHMQMRQSINNADFIQIIFFTILFFLAINEWQKANADAEKKKTQLEMNRLYYDAYDELILLIRERQHDMKNHINAILGMIYTIDNYEELVESQKKYCDDVVIKNKETKLLLAVGNPLIAGFLYRKFQEAQKVGITIEQKTISKENSYFIPEYELIEMMGVLIDNAIEALIEMEWKEKRILVKINDKEAELLVSIANISRYYDPDEIIKFFQRDFTTKGKGHGIGLPKLKRMVQERDGDVVVTNEKMDDGNYLEFCIILPKKKHAFE